MTLSEALKQLVENRNLSRADMRDAMRTLMSGQATPAQIGGFLVALRMKGETVDEIAAAAEVMRELVLRVPVAEPFRDTLVDTCGTGGDAGGLFNVSTAAAFVVAAGGGRVAKHGNRAVSGKSGSADVLEAAGVKLELSPPAVARCIEELGVGFMFAPVFHAAMKHAIGPRREMGVRTIFNLLGPLTNPAGARNQVLGVFDRRWLKPLAEVLKALGSRHVLVVHSQDGLDEISIAAPTHYAELKNGTVRTGTLRPAALGVVPADLKSLSVQTAADSLGLIREALGNRPGPAREMVAVNAAAALYVSGLAKTLKQGVQLARRTLESGGALQRLEALAKLTHSL
ncbi:MAG: anthranilate phosphoribosyltransferase [Nevskiales bacterium]|nr:anthranilate phosphoribosyltransferase [Nevskiales bacterium]